MLLVAVVPGRWYVIKSIRDSSVRRQAMYLGMGEGEEVYCCEKTGDGPVVLARSGQLIAVGTKTARDIVVLPKKSAK